MLKWITCTMDKLHLICVTYYPSCLQRYQLPSPKQKWPWTNISLWKLWWCQNLKRTFLCSIYKQKFKRKWEASSLINLHMYKQLHISNLFIIILDRNRSYIRKLQLRHIIAYKILDLLSQKATKKCPGILASTTFLLRMILNISNVPVSLSGLFQRFMTDRMNKDWYNNKWHLGIVLFIIWWFSKRPGSKYFVVKSSTGAAPSAVNAYTGTLYLRVLLRGIYLISTHIFIRTGNTCKQINPPFL